MLKPPMRPQFVALLISLVVFAYTANSVELAGPKVQIGDLTRTIPPRTMQDLTGSQFVQYVSKMTPQEREEAIRDEILKGNVPAFLRKLVPVELRGKLPNGKDLSATIFVAPDYLAIGSDGDFVRIPMNLHSAIAIANRFNFILPTKKMVDAIYLQSRYHLVPQPLPAGPEMRSTAYYWTHNQLIDEQIHLLRAQLGELIAGDKKDVVMTNRLATNLGRIAIYGWHRGPGQPIQPLSTVHGVNYADYSHGIRLISKMALINGELRSVNDILNDSSTATVLSDEGPIKLDWDFLLSHQYSSPFVTASHN